MAGGRAEDRFETNTEQTTMRGGEGTGKSSLLRLPSPATPCDLQTPCCQGDQLIGSDMSSPQNCCLFKKNIRLLVWKFKGQLKLFKVVDNRDVRFSETYLYRTLFVSVR